MLEQPIIFRGLILKMGFERYHWGQFLGFLLLSNVSNKRHGLAWFDMGCQTRICSPFRHKQSSNFVQRISDLTLVIGPLSVKLTQAPSFTINPAFPQVLKRIDTSLPTTFQLVKIEKCHKISSLATSPITQTLSTSHISITTLHPIVSLGYWHGCLHWSQEHAITTSELSEQRVQEPGCWKQRNSDAGIMAVRRMSLIMRPYSATAVQDRERAISCK